MFYTVTFATNRTISTDDKGVAIRLAARIGGVVTMILFGEVVVVG